MTHGGSVISLAGDGHGVVACPLEDESASASAEVLGRSALKVCRVIG